MRFRFSVERLKNLPLPEKTQVHYDSDEPKLALRVQPTGRKVFWVIKQLNGKPERKTLGVFPEMPIEAARKHARSLLVELAEWRNKKCVGPSPLARAAESFTLKEGFETYVRQALRPRADAEKRDVPATEDRRRKLFLRYWKAQQSRPISSIATTEVQNWYDQIREKNGPIAANRALGLLRTLCKFLVSKNLVAEDPTRTVKLFSEKKRKRKRYLNASEVVRLLQALDAEKNRDIADFVELLLETGVRKSSLYSAKWADVDFQQGTWTIGKTKNGESHTVLLTEEAAKLFKARKEKRENGSPWVFPSKASRPGKKVSKSGHAEDYQAQWYRVLRNAGFEPASKDRERAVTIQDLRRTKASWMAINGASLQFIGDVLGHEDLKSTEIYARLMPSAVRDASQAGGQRMRLEAEKAKQMETTAADAKLLAG